MSKKLSKYIASFDYFEKSIIVLFITNGSISIVSFATVIEAPVRIASAVSVFPFQLLQELLKIIENNKK